MSGHLEPSAAVVRDEKLFLQMGLTEEEYTRVQKLLGRLPNYTETGLFAVLWSEHCSYKNSKKLLKHLPTEGLRVLQGPGEGAGVVDIGDGQGVVFKIESHNHPSAVEPYQGAATGVGGILRDVFSMGAKPVAVLNSLRLGELTDRRNRGLLEGIIAGIAGYGNTIGVPTVGGETQFDSSYNHNPLVNAMAVGLVDAGNLQRGLAAGVGNPVIYAGAKTGRDGIHGATFASVEFDAETGEDGMALQIGYPEIGKKLMEACLEVVKSSALVGIQDMGAAGLTSSSAEMASKAGTGIEMNLDFVPQSEKGMTAYEMMLSESQERMLLVAEAGREAEIIELFTDFGLEAAVIGRVIEEQKLRLLHLGEVKADVPIAALVDDAPVYDREAKKPAYFGPRESNVPRVDDLAETFLNLLKQPTVAEKAILYKQFDTEGETVILGPGSNAAVVAVPGTNKALALTVDCNSRYVYLDPRVGAACAVAEAARNIVCAGGVPLAVTDGLNFGSPTNPETFWQMEQSVAGIAQACTALGTPVVGGNVSLSNETNGRAIFPTPIIGMVGLVEDVDLVTGHNFRQAGDLIYLCGTTKAEFGGSELQKMLAGEICGRPPALDLEVEQRLQDRIMRAIRSGVVQSACDLSVGGLAVALAKCVTDSGLGANVQLGGDLVAELFSESQSRFLLSVRPENKDAFEAIVEAAMIGVVTKEPTLQVFNWEEQAFVFTADKIRETWKGAMTCLLS